ncbi:MAG: hypothetical protein QMD50_02970 [Patescibacteria group bacterium]|nr:hypothetical protein [Patescibacteria group bacterium]
MAIILKIKSIIDHVLARAFILFEVFIFLRLLLKFLDANPEAFVVKHFYNLTEKVIWPFNSIFNDYIWNTYLIEMATVSAIIGYAILFFIFYTVVIFLFTVIQKIFSKSHFC